VPVIGAAADLRGLDPGLFQSRAAVTAPGGAPSGASKMVWWAWAAHSWVSRPRAVAYRSRSPALCGVAVAGSTVPRWVSSTSMVARSGRKHAGGAVCRGRSY
jgi:hypothetical protein